MRGAKYHGSFEHPVRAFVIGVTLLVLLFGGFVVGVEAGTHPLEQAAVTQTEVTTGSVHSVTVSTPATTVVNGHTKIIRLASTKTRLVIVRLHGKNIVAYVPAPGSTSASGPESAAAPTLVSVTTETVTTPPETITEPPVTVTVTEPGTTDTSATSNSSTTSP